MRAWRALAITILAAACSPHVANEGDAGSVVASASLAADAPDAALPPLAGAWLEKLALPAGNVAYVAPPLGSQEPRPVIVAVHGAADHPGYMCSAWRVIADLHAFIVCPAGTRVSANAYTWSSTEAIAAAVDAALAAARARYGDRMASGPLVYAAFSQGATLAAPALRGGRFARAALTEGGYRTFDSDEVARAFVRGGGQRVLYTCAQGGCTGSFGPSRASLTRAGALVRIESPGPYGHSMTPEVRASLSAALPWLVEGLAGWEGYAAAPKLTAH